MNLIFKREEQKYRVPAEAQAGLWEMLAEDFVPAEFSRGTNCSLYYDTAHHDLIIGSMEKPAYKEKLRLRSYGIPGEDSIVFIELKKKYKGITYKRRESLPYADAVRFLDRGIYPARDTQIMREIDHFLETRDVKPSILIAYDRCSYCGAKDPALRATVDRNIRYRTDELRLDAGDSGHLVDLKGDMILELKAESALPLKLVRTLRRLSLYPCSFSKFATAYTQEMMQQNQNLLQQKHLAMPPEEVAAAQRGITPVWNEYLAFAARYKEKRAGMAGSSNIAGMAGTVSMAGASGTI